METMRQHFRPEFLNRVDEIIIFKNLSLADIKRIVDIQLGTLRKRLAERGVNLELTDAAKEYMAERGYDPVYGARPLKRALQKEIVDSWPARAQRRVRAWRHRDRRRQERRGDLPQEGRQWQGLV